MLRRTVYFSLFFSAYLLPILPARPDEAASERPIKIGMSSSIFVDVPPVLVRIVVPSFNQLTREATGLNGQMVLGGDSNELLRKLNANEVQLASFPGIEFAWVHQKQPDLVPVMIAQYRRSPIHATLIVRKDSDIAGFTELRGKDIAFPLKTKGHCRLFLERHCAECGQCEPKQYFSQVHRPYSMEDSLDDVCGGVIQGTIVDAEIFENYRRIKPGCAARLKIAKKSEAFPPAMICTRKGVLSEETLNRFREGMLSAHKSDGTRELMRSYMITSFEPVPKDYFHYVSEIVKTYPEPDQVSAKTPAQ